MKPYRIAAETPNAEPVPELRAGELLLEGSFSEYDRWLNSIKEQDTALALVRPWKRAAARVIRLHFSSRTRSAYGNMDDVLRDCTNPEAKDYHPADSHVGSVFCRTYPKQRTWNEIILLGELWHNQARRIDSGIMSYSSSSEYKNSHPIITRSGWGGRMEMGYTRRAHESIPSHYLLETYYYDYLKGREMWALFYRII